MTIVPSVIAHRAAMHVPPALLRRAKRSIRYPRYYGGLAVARRGFKRYGGRYTQPFIFVAGLPKSGTSWIESMLAAYPGYAVVAPPEIAAFDYANGGTHAFELPQDFFSRLGDALCVIKIHCHGSPNNRRVLDGSGVRYTILYRDLRDAAVSHVHYVKRTPWHPEYPAYRSLEVRAALHHFARTLLVPWRDWINSWQRWRDLEKSLELRYEDMLRDAPACMRQVAAHYGLPLDPIASIVCDSAFHNTQHRGSFYRQGRAGDWLNHFDRELKDTFKRAIGDDLVRWGYERDLSW